ncbi:hypothetical protein MHUMG1_01542 [Metarhizium humberi]|uniref:LSM complex subunit LSM4 n=1 Tax=Metarhizium humberi TaxID=2596975 RepID=A0A9P8SBP4_9HYPO|nr:hypothetical protein MHUMG1_01542 [Metarhizium humberi]
MVRQSPCASPSTPRRELGHGTNSAFWTQLPLSLLNAAQGHPMLVELKNGETLNGHLVQCDTWMNLTLREVVQTSPSSSANSRRWDHAQNAANRLRSNTSASTTTSSTK